MSEVRVLAPLYLAPVVWRDRMRVQDPYGIWVGGEEWWVPEGFSTDGASVPRVLWEETFSPFQPRVLYAAVLHDWLYTSHGSSKRKADTLFHTLLLWAGVHRVLARAALAAVRVAGGVAWEQDDLDREQMRSITRDLLRELTPEDIRARYRYDPAEWMEETA